MSATPKRPVFLPRLEKNIEVYRKEFDQIPEERKDILHELAAFVERKVKAGNPAELIFICTHNSRRSHISQLWAQAAAAYYSIPNVISYSGGTEATAFNPRAVKAMQEAGFQIIATTAGSNPIYEVKFSEEAPGLKAFSKKYDGEGNPVKNFGAVMTCSHADENCPIITGAEARIPVRYDDPKEFDDTPQEAAKYTERVRQIGREMLYAFSLVRL